MNIHFEWDVNKAAANQRKHGISFELAIQVFNDPSALTAPDRIEGHEQRWQTIGSIGGYLLLLVAHTLHEIDENGQELEIIRIISARRADRKERRSHEKNQR